MASVRPRRKPVLNALTNRFPAARPVWLGAATLLFHDLGARKVVADFSGGTLSSDGGVLLLRQVDRGLGTDPPTGRLLLRPARSASDRPPTPDSWPSASTAWRWLRGPQRPRLAAARPAPGHRLRQARPSGADRRHAHLPGVALAGAATLNRLELSNNKRTPAHKLPHQPERIEALLLTMGVRCLPKRAREIVVDLDAMGHRLHGLQEGRYFNGYYDDYCYLPLYVFVGDLPLWAQVRTSDHDGAHGVVPMLEKVVAALRQRCPEARIIIRGDSGFCREEILAWCEGQREVYYCLAWARTRC